MKSDPFHVATAALVLAVSTAVFAQDKPEAAATPETAEAPKAKSAVRFEGTDLHLGSLPPITFHGFASQGYLASTEYHYLGETKLGDDAQGRKHHGSLEFNEFGLNASVSPFNRTRIMAQAFTFDIGNVNNYDVFLDYASIEYTFNDQVGLRGGRIRRPGGIYNHIQDVDLARTFVLLPQGIYDARWRDFSTSIDGGEIFGNVSLGRGGSLAYEAYAGMMNLSDEGGVARTIENGLPPAPIGSFEGIDQSLCLGGQLWWNTPLNGLRLGLSGGEVREFTYNAVVNHPLAGRLAMETSGDIPYYQGSIEYVWKDWTFQAEYFTYRYENETLTNGGNPTQSIDQPDSWYLAAARRINKWMEVGTYYSEYYSDTSVRDNARNYQKDAALSLRFDPAPWWILKLEGHYLTGTALLRDDVHNPVRTDDGWWMFAVKTTFSF